MVKYQIWKSKRFCIAKLSNKSFKIHRTVLIKNMQLKRRVEYNSYCNINVELSFDHWKKVDGTWSILLEQTRIFFWIVAVLNRHGIGVYLYLG